MWCLSLYFLFEQIGWLVKPEPLTLGGPRPAVTKLPNDSTIVTVVDCCQVPHLGKMENIDTPLILGVKTGIFSSLETCSYQREYFELENPLIVELEKVWLNIEQGGLHLIVGVSCKIGTTQWSWLSPFWPWPCPYSCGPPKGRPALSTLGIVIMIFVTNNNNLIIATDVTLTYERAHPS